MKLKCDKTSKIVREMTDSEKAESIIELINDCDINSTFLFGWQIEFIGKLCRKQLNNGWIPVSERLPEEHRCSDEDDCYRMSEHVLCSAYNEDINEYETWIDYTVDGEWQTHEYYEGEKLAWQPLPEPWKGVSE